MRLIYLVGSAFGLSMIAMPAIAQTLSTTRDMMGQAQIEAQKRAGTELLRRTEDAGRYQAIGPQANQTTTPSLDGVGTRSALRVPNTTEKAREK